MKIMYYLLFHVKGYWYTCTCICTCTVCNKYVYSTSTYTIYLSHIMTNYIYHFKKVTKIVVSLNESQVSVLRICGYVEFVLCSDRPNLMT